MENENINKKMNDEISSLKNIDEIYCSECGRPIKRAAVICPYCGIQVRALAIEQIKNNKTSRSLKSTENQGTKYLMIPFTTIMIFLCMILLTGSSVGYY